MRGGEISGLQWDRVFLDQHSLYVDRVIDQVDKKLITKLPKMEVVYTFPNLYPGTRTVIVLKQPKTEGNIRTAYLPDTVVEKLTALKQMQEKLKMELGPDGYMDYGLVICQANGRPIMTEHLNKQFKEVLAEMDDLDIDAGNLVFHSIRHTSASEKLVLSGGDLKAVQGDGDWNTPDMVTKRYAHILDENHRQIAEKLDSEFYGRTEKSEPQESVSEGMQTLLKLAQENPELLT